MSMAGPELNALSTANRCNSWCAPFSTHTPVFKTVRRNPPLGQFDSGAAPLRGIKPFGFLDAGTGKAVGLNS